MLRRGGCEGRSRDESMKSEQVSGGGVGGAEETGRGTDAGGWERQVGGGGWWVELERRRGWMLAGGWERKGPH